MNRIRTSHILGAIALFVLLAVGTARADVVKSFLEVLVVNDAKQPVPALVVNGEADALPVEDLHRVQDPFHETVYLAESVYGSNMMGSLVWSQDTHVIEHLSVSSVTLAAVPAGQETLLRVTIADERTGRGATHELALRQVGNIGTYTLSTPIRLVLLPGMSIHFEVFTYSMVGGPVSPFVVRVSASGYVQR